MLSCCIDLIIIVWNLICILLIYIYVYLGWVGAFVPLLISTTVEPNVVRDIIVEAGCSILIASPKFDVTAKVVAGSTGTRLIWIHEVSQSASLKLKQIVDIKLVSPGNPLPSSVALMMHTSGTSSGK